VVVAKSQGLGLSVVRLLRTDCLGPGICTGSDNDESDYFLGHYLWGHHHHLEVPEGFKYITLPHQFQSDSSYSDQNSWNPQILVDFFLYVIFPM